MEVAVMSLEIEEQKQVQNENTEGQSINAPKTITENDIEAVREGLRKIDKEYEGKYLTPNPDEIYEGLDYINSNVPSEREMKIVASGALEDYRKSNIDKINREHDIDIENIRLQTEKVNQDLENSKYQYAQNLQSGLATNQAQNIANGVQSSSIAFNGQQGVQDRIDYELQKSLNEANRKLAEISFKRSIVENEFQVALDKFDIKYASELEKKVDELNEKYLKTQSDAEKYNERISEQRAKVLKNWERMNESANSKISADKQHEKMMYLLEKMQNLTKREAFDILNDPEIHAQIGDWYKTAIDFATRKVYKIKSEK